MWHMNTITGQNRKLIIWQLLFHNFTCWGEFSYPVSKNLVWPRTIQERNKTFPYSELQRIIVNIEPTGLLLN
jgi:hypothetical protein